MARWDPRIGRLPHTLDARQSAIWASAFTPDGRFALTAGRGTSLRLWEFDWELAASSAPGCDRHLLNPRQAGGEWRRKSCLPTRAEQQQAQHCDTGGDARDDQHGIE